MKTNIRRNSFWLLFARAAAQVLSILFTAIIARRLGVDDFGRFAFVASVVFIGNTFTNFGTDNYLIRNVARAGRIMEIGAQSLSLQAILSVIFCLGVLVFRDAPVFVYSLALFPLAVFSINNALLRAMDRMDLFSGLSLLSGAVQALAALFSSDVLTLCILLSAGHLSLAVISFAICRASLPDYRLFPLVDFRPIFKLVLPFAMLAVLLVVIQRLGILSAAVYMDDAATGVFSSVVRVVEGLKLGHYAVLGALLPVISRSLMDSRRSFRKAFMLLMGTSFAFAVGLVLFSKPVILILYGSEFLGAESLLALLGWSLVPYTISSFISYDLIARGREYAVVGNALLSLCVHAALYIWLIPFAGLTGATWAALAGEFFEAIVFAVSYWVIVRRGPAVDPK